MAQALSGKGEVMLSALTRTRLEKTALDNGFDVSIPAEGDWLGYESSQTPLRVWLSATDNNLFVFALSHRLILNGLDGEDVSLAVSLPEGACGAHSVKEFNTLHHTLRRAFQLSKEIFAHPSQVFVEESVRTPIATEAEYLSIQRIGQDMFRKKLIDYWAGRCCISGLAVVELLRASHIKPWADCETDAERLDVFNGFLLAPHLDAVFDRGFITADTQGHIMLAEELDTAARSALGFTNPMQIVGLTHQHRTYLSWHRTYVFRDSVTSKSHKSPKSD